MPASSKENQIDRVCAGLAVLRPLSSHCPSFRRYHEFAQEAIRSFALDIGRPLLVADDAIQFRDEPVETWFQRRYKPPSDKLGEFVRSLVPLGRKRTPTWRRPCRN